MSRAFRVEYSPEAFEDLRAIYSYIAFHLAERDTAKKQIDRIRREVRALNKMPERYAAVDWEPWASMNMRKLPVDHYVVYYSVDRDAQLVQIIRVFYGGRDMESIVRGEDPQQ